MKVKSEIEYQVHELLALDHQVATSTSISS